MKRTSIAVLAILSVSVVLIGCNRSRGNQPTVTSQPQAIQAVQPAAPPPTPKVEMCDSTKEKELTEQIKRVLELPSLSGDARAVVASDLKDTLLRTSPTFRAASSTIDASAKQLSSQSLQLQYVSNHLRDDAIDWSTVANESSTAIKGELAALKATRSDKWEMTPLTWVMYDSKRELLYFENKATRRMLSMPLSLTQFDKISSRYSDSFHQEWVHFVEGRADQYETARRDGELGDFAPTGWAAEVKEWANQQSGRPAHSYFAEHTFVAGRPDTTPDGQGWNTLALADKSTDEILVDMPSHLDAVANGRMADVKDCLDSYEKTIQECYSWSEQFGKSTDASVGRDLLQRLSPHGCWEYPADYCR